MNKSSHLCTIFKLNIKPLTETSPLELSLAPIDKVGLYLRGYDDELHNSH